VKSPGLLTTPVMRERYPGYACTISFDTPLMREPVPSICVEIRSFPQSTRNPDTGAIAACLRRTWGMNWTPVRPLLPVGSRRLDASSYESLTYATNPNNVDLGANSRVRPDA
jgi:hypothetical protein